MKAVVNIKDAGFKARSYLQTALYESGLHASLRPDCSAQWQEIAQHLAYIPVSYSSAMIDYQLSYWQRPETGGGCVDLSLLLMHDQRPCGLWPLSLRWTGDETALHVGSSGGDLEPPLFVRDLAEKSIRQLTSRCLDMLVRLLAALGQHDVQCAEPFTGQPGLSHWHDRLMRYGAKVTLRHELFADLTPDLAAIKRVMRKSYKSLISSGEKLWQIGLLESRCSSVWDEYRALHLAVAGRTTRSRESWEAQHCAIDSGDAFLVYLRDTSGRMVGGGLFHCTRDEGVYAVGAYDRTLFDKPLGHVVQFRAIAIMKQRGVRWYRIGQRPYAGEMPAPTEKELAIADFKQGFASHLMPRYIMRAKLGLRANAQI